MKLLKKLFKKFHSRSGITGTDVAAAIAVITMTMGVVTGIYINVTNKSKENIRYSNATRIATQIVENIEANTYQDLIIKTNSETTSKVAKDDAGKIFDVNIPKGYSATVTSTKPDSDILDVVRDISVTVTYEVSNTDRTIKLNIIKKRELLEQTNKPKIEEIPEYTSDKFVPIKKTTSGYVVTVTSDSKWYNYDRDTATGKAEYALVARLATPKETGTLLNAADIQDIYIWVPRFGITSGDTLTSATLGFAYGTSDYLIKFGGYTSGSNKLVGYMLTYGTDGSIIKLAKYASGTFKDVGITGIWYKKGDTSDETPKRAYDALTAVLGINNL